MGQENPCGHQRVYLRHHLGSTRPLWGTPKRGIVATMGGKQDLCETTKMGFGDTNIVDQRAPIGRTKRGSGTPMGQRQPNWRPKRFASTQWGHNEPMDKHQGQLRAAQTTRNRRVEHKQGQDPEQAGDNKAGERIGHRGCQHGRWTARQRRQGGE